MAESVSIWSRVKFLLVAGVGLFCDGYLNLAIGLGLFTEYFFSQCAANKVSVVQMLGLIYWKDEKNTVKVMQADEMKGGLSLGMIAGQIAFGILGDALGRHRVYGIELIITMFGTLMTVLLPWRGLSKSDIVAWISVWRVVTGFGIGAGLFIHHQIQSYNPDALRLSHVIISFSRKDATRLPRSACLVCILLHRPRGYYIQHRLSNPPGRVQGFDTRKHRPPPVGLASPARPGYRSRGMHAVRPP